MVNPVLRNFKSDESYMDIDGSPKPVLRVQESPKGMLITINHLLMFWSFTAGLMVFVFVVGYHAGRTKGRNGLLEEVSKESARLPIVSTINSGDSGQAEDILSLVKAQPQINPEAMEASSKAAEEEQKFDFAAAEKLPDAIKSGWYLQVGAGNTFSSAQSIAKTFNEKQFTAKIKKITLKDKSLFQVLVGPYSSREEAVITQPKIKALKISRVEPFAVKVQ